jgi:putative hydrolase of the HAD superfamily
MIKLLIFDIGGVIEDFAEEDYIDYICTKLGLDEKEFGDELLRILPSAEEGRISTKEMLGRVALLFGIGVRTMEWSSSMAKLAKINSKVLRLVNALDKRYRLVLLTNVSKSRYMENMRFGLFKKVKCDRVYASCYLGMSKPGQEIYRYVLEKENVRPGEAAFVDNMLVNVQGARKVGIRGVHFIGYAKLVKDLRKLGIRW